MRSHRRTKNGTQTNVKTNEYVGKHSRIFKQTSLVRGDNPKIDRFSLFYPKLKPEVSKSLANIGVEIKINQDLPYVLIYNPELRKQLGRYGIIAEDVGTGRQKNRQFYQSKDPGAISVYDLLFAYQLGLIGPHSNRVSNYNSILAWGQYQDPDFMEKLSVYLDLRSKGLIVMSGTRYGTDFTIYAESAEKFHSKNRNKSNRLQTEVALIDVGSVGTNMELPEAIKGEHLAKSIGKTYMIASANGKRDSNGHLIFPSQFTTFRIVDIDELGIDSNIDISAQIAKRLGDNTEMVPWELRPRFR